MKLYLLHQNTEGDEMPKKAFSAEEFVEEFWKKVDIRGPNDCWEWRSDYNHGEYGKVGVGRKIEGAHRVSYILANGEVPDGMWVLHKCDNPPCVNPAHLFLGTRDDNVKDMIDKGRGKAPSFIGELNSSAKLTEENVTKIRNMHKSGNYTHRELAIIFGVDHTQISNIVNRKNWSHIP